MNRADERGCTRREAIAMVGGGMALAPAGCKLLGASHRKVPPASPRVVAGKLAVPLRDLTWLKPGLVAEVDLVGYPPLLITPRPEGGYYVVTGECTHFGCTVGWNLEAREWRCPCHGSWFRWDGRVVRDPAKEDLQAPGVTVTATDLVIDLGGIKRT